MTERVPNCRFCGQALTQSLVDLGATPLANSYVTSEQIAAEQRFPLVARVCPGCFLVQVDDSVPPDAIFSDYSYFSSYSDSWVEHARRYADAMIDRFRLGPRSLVVEVASNDGYLLQHFAKCGVPVLGIEPAANVAAAALAKGIPTEVAFFGEATARSLSDRGVSADLMAANNVLAHVPDIRDFVGGFAVLLKPDGIATFEFPHVLNLLREVQFDTIYHEHFSYLSLVAVERVLEAAGLRAFDVEELATHGGSLRLFVTATGACYGATERLASLRRKEAAAGLDRMEGYAGFADRVARVRTCFREFRDTAKRDGKTVAAYGAAAKGNTFLNYCGVTPLEISCVFDRSAAKQGKLLPGSHLPILAPERMADIAPDYLVILPWNLAEEIAGQARAMPGWKGRFVTAVPEVRLFP